MKKHLLMWCAAVIAATMSLNAQTIVINEGFENGIQEGVWTQEFVSGQTPWMVEDVADGLTYPGTVVQGTKRAYLRNTTGETQGYVTRLVSQVMDLSPGLVYQPELSFSYANPKWGADRDTLRVLYRTNPKGKWKQLAEYSTAMASWQRVKIELPEVDSTYQIAFEGKDNLGRGIVLDSILLRSAPICSVPRDIMVSNKGQDRVNIAWSSSWDPKQFELIVSKDTIDPYELTEEIEANLAFHGLVPRFPHSYDLTLESGEFYLVYIRSICTNEISLWSHEETEGKPFGFRVRATKQIPYAEDFNYPTAQKQDPEWTWKNNIDPAKYKNLAAANPYVNTSTSASALAKYSVNKTKSVIFGGTTTTATSAAIPASNYAYLATPALADTLNENFSLNQCQVRFWSTVYIFVGRQYGRGIIVGVMDDPDDITTFVPVDTVYVWGNQSFVENIVDLSSYEGTGSYVAFVSDFDRPNAFYLDDVTIEYKPEAQKATNITVNPRDTFATISWDGYAPSYHVLITNAEVDPANPSEEAIVDQATVTTNSYVTHALEEDHSWNRPYYVYVQSEGAEWSYRYPFVTIASKREKPYTFDCELTSGKYKIGTGTSYYATGIGIFGNDSKYPSISSANPYKNSGCLFLNKTAGTDVWITLPMVEELDSTQVKFYLSGNTTYSQAHASVGVMTNPMDINTFTKVASFTLNTIGYTMCYANFRNYTGEDGVIAILWDDIQGMAKNTINYIDEIKVEKLSECVPPSNLSLDVMSDSITLRWDKSTNSTWEVVISRSALTTTQRDKSFQEIAAMSQVVYADTLVWDDQTTNPVFGIGGLRDQTDYVMYVRTVCFGDAAWWTELSFHTPCPDAPFPFKEDFEKCTSTSSNAAPQLSCWQMINYLGTSYPYIYGANGGKVLELWTSGTSYRCVAMMPEVAGDLSDMMLSFETRSWSSSGTSTLYVGTMGDINDQNSFVPFDTIYNTGGSEFQRVRLILSDYDLAYNNIAFSSGLGSASSDVLIDNIELRDATCIEAFGFQQTAETENSVDFTWQGLSTNDQWEICVLNTSVSVANVAAGNYDPARDAVVNDTIITGKTFHVEDLQPISTYYVYIRALCGDSVWTNYQVTTACMKHDPNLPNKETFDDYQGGSSYSANYQAPCWTVGNTSSSATSSYIPYIYNTASYASSGSNTYRLYGSYYSYGPAYVVSPEIDITHMKELAVTFNMYCSSSYYWICGVVDDPHDMSTFVVLDSVKGEGKSVQYIYDLSEYEALIPATAKYFAWRTPYDETSYAYLDDVSITKMTCPFTKPSYSDLTGQSVRISSGLRTDDEWLLLITNTEISTDQLSSPTYHVPESIKVFYDTIDVRSARVNNLSDQTTYYVYTATLCDSTVSQWRTLSFTTPCAAIKPEAMGVITFSSEEGYSTGTSGEMPCWTKSSKTQGASSSYIPYVDNSSSMKHNGKNYLYIHDEFSTYSNYVGAYAIMPELLVDSINKYQVNFWARGSSYSSYNSQIIVGVVADPSNLNTFVPIDTLNLSHTGWEPYSVGFENYEGDYMGRVGSNIMFLSDFGVTNYAYISEISVDLIPTCRPVSTFSVDSVGENQAVISWKGYQESYRLLVADKMLEDNEKDTYHYLLDSIVDHSSRVRISGLQSASTYYVYARGFCGDNDSTDVSQQFATVRTECPLSTGIALPFSDNFMSYEVGAVDPGCWIFRGSSWTKIASVTSGEKTFHAIDLYTSGTSNNGYIVVPVLAAPLEDLQVTFETRMYGSSAGTLHIGTIADPEDPTTFVEFTTMDVTSSDFESHTLTLGDYPIEHERLVFTSGLAGASSSDIYITNISLTVVSTCHAPKLKVTGTTFNSVDIQLTPAKPDNDLWELAIIPDSVHAKLRNVEAYLNNTAEHIRISETNYTFTDLTPATSYDIYARTVCGGTDGLSPWSKEPLKVHTQFYFRDGYTFGFEKTELWEQSMYSKSDNYYIHPALVADRDTLGMPSTTYSYYPYSQENTTSAIYAHTGTGALTMYSSGNYHGGYVIFPVVDIASDRSFEFKVRPGYASASSKQMSASNDAVLEIGTVDANKSFDTYQPLATIRLDKLASTAKATEDNNYLFQYFTLDLDAATVANKQLVLHSPKQPSVTSTIFIDDVILGEAKGYSLVALDKVTPAGTSALVEWTNIGGPWNLYIKDAEGAIVKQYLNLSGVTSQVVDGLQPRTAYTAELVAVNAPETTDYVVSSSLSFITVCQTLEPDENGAFSWDFNDENEWEANDVLVGTASDSLYLKPSCFTVGITYESPANGYQWLVQRKGYDYYSTAISGSSYEHYEVGRDDSPALRVYTSSTNFNSYIVLPALNCDYDTMMVEFYGRCFTNYDEDHTSSSSRGKIVGASYLGAGYSQSLVVGTLSDPNDFSTLQILDTLTYRQTHLTTNDNVNDDPAGLRYWELMQLPLTGAQGAYIVLFQPAPGLFFVDDLSIKPIGSTLFAPSNARTTDITDHSAEMAWDVHHPDLASVVVVLNSMDEEIARDTVAGTSYAINTLNPGMSYQWYVYQTDLVNNSATTQLIPFATQCISITPSYTAGFEREEGWSYIPDQKVYTQALCWTYADALREGWSSTYDGMNVVNTETAEYSHSGSYAVFMKGSYSNYNAYQPYIAMPAMDITAYDTLQVAFWMRPAYVNASTGKIGSSYTGNSYSKSVIVGTMTDPNDASTFVAIDTITYEGTLSTTDEATAANNYLFQLATVELTGATGPYVAFMTSFYAKGATSRQSLDYIYLDDIAFERINDCKEPTSLRADVVGGDFATLSWTAPSIAQSYVLQVSTDSRFESEDAFVFNDTVYADTYTVTGLQYVTNYVWRVQSLCAGEFSESPFSAKATFKTSRSPYFLEEFTAAVSQTEWLFSSTSATNVVDGTATIVNNDNSYGFKRYTNGYGLPTSHYACAGYLSDYNWMLTPIFYLPENDSVHFSMDLALTACNTSHAISAAAVSESDMKDDYYFMIIVSEDGGATWKSENILAKWQNTNPEGKQLRDIPSTGMNVRLSLAQYAGKNVRIGLYREAVSSSNTGIAIHVDNIRLAYFEKVIDYASGCQYEEIVIGDIVLPDDTEPGIHIFPSSEYVSDEEAKAGVKDTVYSMEIEVFPAEGMSFDHTMCEGETYTDVNFHGKDQSGIYRRKMESSHGCDSIITLNLTVIPRTYAEDLEVAICQGDVYVWNFNNKTYNRAGIFYDTIPSAAGCDSIGTLIVSYQPSEDTIRVNKTITLNELPYSYEDPEHPYIASETPIYYDKGTQPGVYTDIKTVEGEHCYAVLVHTLTILDDQEGVDNIFGSQDGARKVIYQEQMYIIVNDEWYTPTGQKVADPRQ